MWLYARQSEIFTEFPLKGFFKLLDIIRCLFRNVKRFQNCVGFLVDEKSELGHAVLIVPPYI